MTYKIRTFVLPVKVCDYVINRNGCAVDDFEWLSKNDSSVTYIQYKYKDGIMPMSNLNIDIKNHKIELTQEPRETITLGITVKVIESHDCNRCNIQKNCLNYSYDVQLNCNNYLGNSSYQILAQITMSPASSIIILGDHKRPHRDHITLFRKTIYNCTNIITPSPTLFLPVSIKDKTLEHLCLRIKRITSPFSMTGPDKLGTSVSQATMARLRQGLYSDVSLVCGDDVIPAHKDILSENSQYFTAMFTHDMTEQRDSLVKIEDFDAEIINELLNHIYLGKVERMDKVAAVLYEAAQRYEIHQLVRECAEYLMYNVNPNNVVGILDLALLYGDKNIKCVAEKCVDAHIPLLVKTDSYKKHLIRQFSADSMFKIFDLCENYDLNDLKLEALEYTKKNFKTITKNEQFLSLIDSHPAVMKEILRSIATVD